MDDLLVPKAGKTSIPESILSGAIVPINKKDLSEVSTIHV